MRRIPHSAAPQFRFRHDPERDWRILLAAAALILAGIVAWNIRAFSLVADGKAFGAVAAPAPEVFKRSSLDAVQKTFADRAVEAAKYETGVYRFSDPSQY